MRTSKSKKLPSKHPHWKSLILIQSYFRSFSARNALTTLQKNIVTIQRHTRGFLQRKRFRPMLIDKLLKEQEEAYQHRVFEVEEALGASMFSSPEFSDFERVSIFDLPLPLSQCKWFSPSKNKKLLQPIIFDLTSTHLQPLRSRESSEAISQGSGSLEALDS